MNFEFNNARLVYVFRLSKYRYKVSLTDGELPHITMKIGEKFVSGDGCIYRLVEGTPDMDGVEMIIFGGCVWNHPYVVDLDAFVLEYFSDLPYSVVDTDQTLRALDFVFSNLEPHEIAAECMIRMNFHREATGLGLLKKLSKRKLSLGDKDCALVRQSRGPTLVYWVPAAEDLVDDVDWRFKLSVLVMDAMVINTIPHKWLADWEARLDSVDALSSELTDKFEEYEIARLWKKSDPWSIYFTLKALGADAHCELVVRVMKMLFQCYSGSLSPLHLRVKYPIYDRKGFTTTPRVLLREFPALGGSDLGGCEFGNEMIDFKLMPTKVYSIRGAHIAGGTTDPDLDASHRIRLSYYKPTVEMNRWERGFESKVYPRSKARELYENGWRPFGAHVIVFYGGSVYFQLRDDSSTIPDCLDFTASGMVQAVETTLQAAKRELNEETFINDPYGVWVEVLRISPTNLCWKGAGSIFFYFSPEEPRAGDGVQEMIEFTIVDLLEHGIEMLPYMIGVKHDFAYYMKYYFMKDLLRYKTYGSSGFHSTH